MTWFKVVFIILFIFLNIYLIIRELRNVNLQNIDETHRRSSYQISLLMDYINNGKANIPQTSPFTLQAGILDSNLAKHLKSIAATVSGAAGVYGGYVSYKQDNNKDANAKINQLSNDYNSLGEVVKNLDIREEDKKNRFTAIMGRLLETHGETARSHQKLLKAQEELDKKFKLLAELKGKGNTNTPEAVSNLNSEVHRLSEDAHRCSMEISRSLRQEESELAALNKLNETGPTAQAAFIFSEVFDYYSSLDPMGKFALSLLLLDQVIFSLLTSIVFIFYGDYLIKRFDLEKKFPNLAKVIQLRRRFQSYYLLLSIIWIFVVLFIQCFFCVLILLV